MRRLISPQDEQANIELALKCDSLTDEELFERKLGAHLNSTLTTNENIERICDFVSKSSGLQLVSRDHTQIFIIQKIDGQHFSLIISAVEEVLIRKDSEQRLFLQINYSKTKKVLLTDNLIGFKPAAFAGLDLSKLPRVVTTPDIQSVRTAIEEMLSNETTIVEEVDVLRRVFESVIEGAEQVGFQMPSEREWLKRISTSRYSASA